MIYKLEFIKHYNENEYQKRVFLCKDYTLTENEAGQRFYQIKMQTGEQVTILRDQFDFCDITIEAR